MTSRLDRRSFLAAGTAGLVGAHAALVNAAGSSSFQGANDRVGVGVIGTGMQGRSDLRAHARLEDVEIRAICDVYEPNLAKGAEPHPRRTS